MITENIVLFKINIGGYSCSICNTCFKFIYQHNNHLRLEHSFFKDEHINFCYRNNKEDISRIRNILEKKIKKPFFIPKLLYKKLYNKTKNSHRLTLNMFRSSNKIYNSSLKYNYSTNKKVYNICI